VLHLVVGLCSIYEATGIYMRFPDEHQRSIVANCIAGWNLAVFLIHCITSIWMDFRPEAVVIRRMILLCSTMTNVTGTTYFEGPIAVAKFFTKIFSEEISTPVNHFVAIGFLEFWLSVVTAAGFLLTLCYRPPRESDHDTSSRFRSPRLRTPEDDSGFDSYGLSPSAKAAHVVVEGSPSVGSPYQLTVEEMLPSPMHTGAPTSPEHAAVMQELSKALSCRPPIGFAESESEEEEEKEREQGGAEVGTEKEEEGSKTILIHPKQRFPGWLIWYKPPPLSHVETSIIYKEFQM